ETYDVIRQEPVFVIKAITHRHDAIWQALLPGALEHKLLMGMPREQGSSLDPSSESGTHFTTKMGFDLTKPLVAHGKDFNRAPFPAGDLGKFLK
ncbi:MAG TPA: hypothetical protein VLG46_10130, partial [Anaerolineae bacterium]|nr:hypothetical protein [Anaerolineae bacterium]